VRVRGAPCCTDAESHFEAGAEGTKFNSRWQAALRRAATGTQRREPRPLKAAHCSNPKRQRRAKPIASPQHFLRPKGLQVRRCSLVRQGTISNNFDFPASRLNFVDDPTRGTLPRLLDPL